MRVLIYLVTAAAAALLVLCYLPFKPWLSPPAGVAVDPEIDHDDPGIDVDM